MKQLTINLQNIQTAHAVQYQKNEQPSQNVGERTEQTFLQKDIQMANKHMKRCSTSLKCKSKPQWSIISHWSEWPPSKSLQTVNAGDGVEKKELSYTVGACKLVQPLWRTEWRVLKKLEIELPYDPAIPLLGIRREETRTERDVCPNVHCSTVYNSQDMEAT